MSQTSTSGQSGCGGSMIIANASMAELTATTFAPLSTSSFETRARASSSSSTSSTPTSSSKSEGGEEGETGRQGDRGTWGGDGEFFLSPGLFVPLSPCPLVRCCGQRDGEGRALSFACARRLDLAAVHLDQLLYQRQAQAQAAVTARVRSVLLSEAVKNAGQEFGRNAFARVAHGERQARPRALECHFHSPAFGREFDGVGEQVPDDLLQPLGVPRDLPGLGGEFRGEPDEFRVRRRAHCFDRFADHGAEIKRPDLDLQLAGDDAG